MSRPPKRPRQPANRVGAVARNMLWGTAADMRLAIKRLDHFKARFPVDGPFTALTPFGRNLALFHDCGNRGDKPEKDELIGLFGLLAGAGRLLSDKCERVHVDDSIEMQSEIAAWWWRANAMVSWKLLFG